MDRTIFFFLFARRFVRLFDDDVEGEGGEGNESKPGRPTCPILRSRVRDVYFQERHANGATLPRRAPSSPPLPPSFPPPPRVHEITRRAYTKKRRAFPFVFEEDDDL